MNNGYTMGYERYKKLDRSNRTSNNVLNGNPPLINQHAEKIRRKLAFSVFYFVTDAFYGLYLQMYIIFVCLLPSASFS